MEPEPLRICLAIGTLELGGAETQVVGTARALLAAGHDVEVMVLSHRGPLASLLDEVGIPIHALGFDGLVRDGRGRLKLRRSMVSACRLFGAVAHLRHRRVEVMHAYLFGAYAVLVPLALLAGVPVRIAARRGLHTSLPSTAVVRILTWLSTKLATVVVANADAVAVDAHRNESVPRRKLRVIRNGVDVPARCADPATFPPVGLMVANLIHYKGHLDLVNALSLLDDPPVVRCVGEGPMRAQIEAAIRHAGLVDRVILEGIRRDARELCAEAQFAILASHEEGMPNSVMEAMAAGLPVLATDVGGASELVVDGVTGLLVPPRDPEGMALALRRMASDVAFRESAGAAGRERAKSFGWDRVARAHIDLYRGLLGRAP